jgi:hypothetical protein
MIWFFSAVKPDDRSVRKGGISRRTGFFFVHEFRSASLCRARAEHHRLRERECGTQNFRRGAGSQNVSEYDPGPVERNATASNNCVSAYSAPPLPISNPLGRCTRKIAPSITTTMHAAPSRNKIPLSTAKPPANCASPIRNPMTTGQ